MIRKYVTPADPGASIPDPARGRDLPPGGIEVAWGAHWARLERRGDITVTDVPEAPEASPGAPGTVPAAPPAPPEPAGRPTRAAKSESA